MPLRSCRIVAAGLLCTVRVAPAQNVAAPDSDLSRSVGHWVASGVSFQSRGRAHPFAVDVSRVGDRLRVTVPAELTLAGGKVYLLARAGGGVFRHVDDAGRRVEFSLTSRDHASLLVTGSAGDGRVTWQLTR